MVERDRTLCEKVAAMERLLEEERKKAAYFQHIAEETGRKRLREIDQLSRLIEKHREAQEALRQSEFKFRSLFDFSPQAIALIDLETGRFVEVNDKLCELTGYKREALLCLHTGNWGPYPPKVMFSFLDGIKTAGKVDGLEMNFNGRDGSALHTLMFGRLMRIGERLSALAAFVDLTNQKHLESKLLHAQKMEALGALAGGIAHDFNNLLMAIQGNASLALLSLEPSDPHFRTFRTIEGLVKSGARLTGQLLGYARKGKYEVRVCDLNLIVKETSETFEGTRKDIRIKRDLARNLFFAEVDPGQIEQVLFNLYVNAADAMPEGGDLFLRTMNVTHEEMAGRVYTPRPGNYLQVRVTDTGKGMDEATKGRIFEPFFTTKEHGKGTGLGLASVFGIVKGHGGYIDCESTLGRGTSFSLHLPATEKKLPRKWSSIMRQEIRQGSETILMVDDEERVLSICVDLLRSLGYKVLQARGGKEAIDLCQESKDGVDLVILDMVMPDMSGKEACERMKQIKPDLKILLSSGYSLNSHVEGILDGGCDGFLQKPYNLTELSRKIQEVLLPAGDSN